MTTLPRGPLAGLLVIDLSRVLSGPYCSLLLADLGARVIKVEPPGSGDDARGFAPFVNGQSAYFAAVNRGKESLALDLKRPEDKAVLERLLDRADVLLDNFRPGVLGRLGFPANRIAERWPKLVHASISGFGQNGPYAGRAAYDLIIQAMSGVMSMTGAEEGGPARVGTSIVDISAGLFATVGVLAALQARASTGRGRFVDVAMFDCQVAMLEHALAQTLGLPGLVADPRFATMADRVANQGILKRYIEQVTSARPTAYWDGALSAAGVASGPVKTAAELLQDPQLFARGMLVDAAGVKVAGNPLRLSGFEPVVQASPAPALDASRAAILAEFC